MIYDFDNWIYENDRINKNRYVLGVKGKRPLLCFGINPSTAKPHELDNTLKSVTRLALINGFDSWIMMNIYPQIATNPNDMHNTFKNNIHAKNLKFIEDVLSANNNTIWAAWGTLIEKRSYLTDCLLDIYELSNKYDSNWISIGKKSKKGHPHHPLYLNSKNKIDPFNMDEYISGLKR